jgi:hypothetical protein
LKALLNYFVDLCLLRTGPQDLPASGVLLSLVTLLNVFVGVVMIADARIGLGTALAESLFEAALMLCVLYIALRLSRRLPRFVQAATALMGSGLLLGLLALPLVAWSHRSESSEAALLLLIVVIWSMVVLGHVLRHTFDIKFHMGLGVALLYTLLSWNLTFMLFPVTN